MFLYLATILFSSFVSIPYISFRIPNSILFSFLFISRCLISKKFDRKIIEDEESESELSFIIIN